MFDDLENRIDRVFWKAAVVLGAGMLFLGFGAIGYIAGERHSYMGCVKLVRDKPATEIIAICKG